MITTLVACAKAVDRMNSDRRIPYLAGRGGGNSTEVECAFPILLPRVQIPVKQNFISAVHEQELKSNPSSSTNHKAEL